MKHVPCPYCEKKFESEDACKRHIRSKRKYGHGKKKCPNCKQPLSLCKDIDGVTSSFQCVRP